MNKDKFLRIKTQIGDYRFWSQSEQNWVEAPYATRVSMNPHGNFREIIPPWLHTLITMGVVDVPDAPEQWIIQRTRKTPVPITDYLISPKPATQWCIDRSQAMRFDNTSEPVPMSVYVTEDPVTFRWVKYPYND